MENNNNLVLIKAKPEIKNTKIIHKKDLILKKTENSEINNNNDNSRLKLGLSLININKHKITETITGRNNTERFKISNYDKIYSYTNNNSNSNSITKLKSETKKNKRIKAYLDKITTPRKGDLNFYVINNIINKEKQVKKKKVKNELFNLEINSNFNKNNYISTANNENIIVKINNNNYINNTLNKNNFQNLNNIISPTFKTKNKNIISQIKVNLKSNKKEKKVIISPKKTEKNSPRRNHQLINIYKKTISPMKELNIRNSNRNSKLLRFNTGITISKKRGKDYIKNNNGNNTNIFLYKNVNVINKEKLKQIANNHRKIKSMHSQNNFLYDYFYYYENEKNNNIHKRKTSSISRSHYSNAKSNTNSNYYDTINNINKNLNYSEEKIMDKKIVYKPKIKIQKNKMINFNL